MSIGNHDHQHFNRLDEGRLALSHTFVVTNPGRFLIHVSATAFAARPGDIGLEVVLNNQKLGVMRLHCNRKGVHHVLTPLLTAFQLDKGNNTIELRTENHTRTDDGDFANITLQRL